MILSNQKLTVYGQSIADEILNRHNIIDVLVKVKDVNQGHAFARKRYVSIPLWAYSEHGLNYFTYYVIHEVTHFITGHHHDSEFKRVERHELKLRGIDIEYRRAYPDKLIANGQVCYENKRRIKRT